MRAIEITKEPNFKTHPTDWVAWNMKEYNNDLLTSLKLLKQRELLSNF